MFCPSLDIQRHIILVDIKRVNKEIYNGFLMIPHFIDSQLDNLNQIIEEIKNIAKNKQPGTKKEYRQAIISHKDLTVSGKITGFILQLGIIEIISTHLDFIPRLNHVEVWNSPKNASEPKGSQFFHLDHEDYSQIKCFLFLSDITLESGPQTLIPKNLLITIEKSSTTKLTSTEKD